MNQIQQSISNIRKGLSIYIICSLVGSVLSVFSLFAAGAAIAGVASGSASMTGGAMVILILTAITTLGVIYGQFVSYGGLKAFASHLDEVGARAVNNLALGALLTIISAIISLILSFVPGGFLLATITLLIGLVAFIFNILGYTALRNSSSLNELGKAGAQQLFMGFIFAIIAVVIVFIPILGSIASVVLNILYWVYLFKGWNKIKISFE